MRLEEVKAGRKAVKYLFLILLFYCLAIFAAVVVTIILNGGI